MISVLHWSRNNRALILLFGLLLSCLWLIVQQSCMGDREASLDSSSSLVRLAREDDALSDRHGSAVGITSKRGKETESLETPSQSLKRASLLLSRAATTLEDDEAMAVQLIRQVISILKHQVIPSLLEGNSALVPIHSHSGVSAQRVDGDGPIHPVHN